MYSVAMPRMPVRAVPGQVPGQASIWMDLDAVLELKKPAYGARCLEFRRAVSELAQSKLFAEQLQFVLASDWNTLKSLSHDGFTEVGKQLRDPGNWNYAVLWKAILLVARSWVAYDSKELQQSPGAHVQVLDVMLQIEERFPGVQPSTMTAKGTERIGDFCEVMLANSRYSNGVLQPIITSMSRASAHITAVHEYFSHEWHFVPRAPGLGVMHRWPRPKEWAHALIHAADYHEALRVAHDIGGGESDVRLQRREERLRAFAADKQIKMMDRTIGPEDYWAMVRVRESLYRP